MISFNNENHFLTNNRIFISRSYSRTRWTSEENKKLIDHVRKNGPRKWKKIAHELNNKTTQQCRDHYNDVLDPKIKNVVWTNDEEKILLLKYEEYGPHWSKIKVFFPGRTAGMIKNYVNLLLKRSNHIDESETNLRKKNSDSNDQQIEKTKNNSNLSEFSYHSIESLLNHPTDLYLQ